MVDTVLIDLQRPNLDKKFLPPLLHESDCEKKIKSMPNVFHLINVKVQNEIERIVETTLGTNMDTPKNFYFGTKVLENFIDKDDEDSIRKHYKGVIERVSNHVDLYPTEKARNERISYLKMRETLDLDNILKYAQKQVTEWNKQACSVRYYIDEYSKKIDVKVTSENVEELYKSALASDWVPRFSSVKYGKNKTDSFDYTINAFVDNALKVSNNKWTSSKEIYEVYTHWCQHTNKIPKGKSNSFWIPLSTYLHQLGAVSKLRNTGSGYLNISIKMYEKVTVPEGILMRKLPWISEIKEDK